MRQHDPGFAPVPSSLHNLEAEAVTLGILLINDKRVDEVAGFLEPRHFFNHAHGRIYALIVGEALAGRRADLITLVPQVENDEALKAAGGSKFLGSLTRGAATTGDLVAYARQVFDLACRRDLVAAAEQIKATVTASPLGVAADVLAAEAEQVVSAVADSRRDRTGTIMNIATAAAETLKRLDAAMQDGAAIVRFGLPSLEEALGALAGNVVVIAGRPGSGKSSLAAAMVLGAAEMGMPSAYVSAEMTSEELTQRWLSSLSGVPYQAMRLGNVDIAGFGQVQAASTRLSAVPLHLRDGGSNGWASVRSDLRYLRRRHGITLAAIDYLQLLAGDRHGESRVAELSEITKDVKATAKDLGMTILLLSQLSRAVESRDDKRPQLHDLRESGSIEQDADAVVCLYREEYYLRKAEPARATAEHYAWLDALNAAKGKAEAIVRKNRHGEERTAHLLFDAPTSGFRPAPEDGAAGHG